MKKDIAEAWVKDLRANPDKQARAVLFDGNGYCCLGRLCVVLGYEFEPARNDEVAGRYVLAGTSEGSVLPESIVQEVDVHDRACSLPAQSWIKQIVHPSGNFRELSSLTAMNDNGYTFAQIADVIESNWEKL